MERVKLAAWSCLRRSTRQHNSYRLSGNSVRDKSNSCIYCGQTSKLSNEHYLPRCLGKFRAFESLNDRICKNCNESFSEIDEQFCRSGPEAIVRALLGIGGRASHRKISPFQRGSAGADRIAFRAKPLSQIADAKEIEMDVDQTGSVRRLRQMILHFETRDLVIRITDDMKEPEQLLERLKKEGVELVAPIKNEGPITAEIIGAAPDEVEWMKHLLSGLERNTVSGPEFRIDDKEEQAKAAMTARPTAKYFRGLAKIGFHYFLKHMSGFHGSEPAFADVRNFIVAGTATDVERFVEGWREDLVTDIVWGESAAGYRHMLIARSNYQELIAKMQFFVPPRYQRGLYPPDMRVLPPYTIRLGKNPSRVDYPRACSHSFTYSEVYKAEGYDGVVRSENIRPR